MRIFIFIFITSGLFVHCKKDDARFQTYFWTNVDTAKSKLSLYIDDKFYGTLPFIPIEPTCENDSSKAKSLFVVLPSGRYKLEAKDQNGTVKSSHIFKIKTNLLSGSGNIGGEKASVKDNCAIVSLYY